MWLFHPHWRFSSVKWSVVSLLFLLLYLEISKWASQEGLFSIFDNLLYSLGHAKILISNIRGTLLPKSLINIFPKVLYVHTSINLYYLLMWVPFHGSLLWFWSLGLFLWEWSFSRDYNFPGCIGLHLSNNANNSGNKLSW